MDGRSVRTTRNAASTLSDGEKLNDSTSCAITFLFFLKKFCLQLFTSSVKDFVSLLHLQ